MNTRFILTLILLVVIIFTQSIPVVLASYEYGSGGSGSYEYGSGGSGSYEYGSGGSGSYEYGSGGSGSYYDDGGGVDTSTPPPVVPPPVVPPPVVPPPVVPPLVVPPSTPTLVSYPSPGGGGYIYYPPTVDIKANSSDGPITIPYGTSVYLYWSSSNALSCWASNGWSGLKSDLGSEFTDFLTTSKTYTITCLGQVGSATDSVTVNVDSTSPRLSVKKSVRNITKNTPYQEVVDALPGEDLSFKIEIELINKEEARNVSVRDILPEEIIYQGNLRIDNYDIPNDLSNIPLSTFVKNQIKTITFDVKVSPEKKFNYGLTALINRAGVKADNFAEVFDPATVNINIPGKVLGATDVVTGINVFYIALMVALVLAVPMYFLIFYLDNSQKPSVRRLVSFLGQIRLFMFR